MARRSWAGGAVLNPSSAVIHLVFLEPWKADSRATLHSLRSAAASARLSLPRKYTSSLKPVAHCVGTGFCSQLCLAGSRPRAVRGFWFFHW